MKKITILLVFLLISSYIFANGVAVVDATDGVFLKLTSCNINTTITNQVAETKTELVFINNTNVNTLTVFSFPLEEQASATNLRWFIDNTWYEAIIAPGEQDSLPGNPEDMYPYLEAHLGKTPLNFAIPDEVEAGDSIIVELTYVQLLDYSFGEVIYNYPSDYDLIQTTNIDNFVFNLEINSDRVIEEVNVDDFPVSEQTNDGHLATLEINLADQIISQDLNLIYTLGDAMGGIISMSSLLDHADVPDDYGDGFFLTLLEPDPEENENVITKVFTLILDRSGSMEGTKITQAKNAASFIVENMNEGDEFNIVDFSTNVRALSVSHLLYNNENEALALNYIDHIYAEGATNISGAFELAVPQFASASDSTANIIIFLTDGEATTGITNTEELVAFTNDLIEDTQTQINLFTFGIGSNVNAQLLTLLAADNGGQAEFLGSGELESVLTEFYLKIRNPVLLSPTIDFIADDVVEIFPDPLPNLYLGQQLLIAGRYQQSTSVETALDGMAFGQPVNYMYDLAFTDSTNAQNQFLTKIWASLKIEHLLVEYYSLDPDSYAAQQLREEIIEISVNYGVICDLTSFTGGVDADDNSVEDILPAEISILGNFPNPFNPETSIKFQVNRDITQPVFINIYNVRGQLINQLCCMVNGRGVYTIIWDGTDFKGSSVSSGVYFYSIDSGRLSCSAKMILLK